MNHLIHQAALENMQGASYLEARDEKQALVSFNNALEYMSQAASNYYCTKLIEQVAAATSTVSAVPQQAVAQPEPTNNSNNSPIPLMAIPKPHDSENDSDMDMEHFKPDNDSADQNPKHFVYCQALVFNPAVARSPVDSLFYSAVVIFNTALCFHNGGAKIDPCSDSKAASLYDICLELLRESATRFNCSHIIISAMNNKACVHMSMNDYTNANTVLDQLLSVMLSQKGSPAAFSENDINGILHNILLLKSGCISPAA